MKKILCFILVISIFFCCMSSCENTVDSDIDYQYGYDDGQAHLFESIWFALSYDEVLASGIVWETEDFSLTLDHEEGMDSSVYPETYLTYDFELKNMTIDECYEGNRMSLCVYSKDTNNDWFSIWIGDDYYYQMYPDVNTKGNGAKGRFGFLGHDHKYLAIIVIIDGSIYKAAYDF